LAVVVTVSLRGIFGSEQLAAIDALGSTPRELLDERIV
jgi:hypothetical protein